MQFTLPRISCRLVMGRMLGEEFSIIELPMIKLTECE